MKNRKRLFYMALFLVLSLASAGCGAVKEKASSVVKATPTPEPEEDLVEMEQSTPSPTPTPEAEKYDHVIGKKTDTAMQVVIRHDLSETVASLYVRVTPENEYSTNWGTELIQEEFVLKKGEELLYYYEPEKDVSGKQATSYDLRISFTDKTKNEYFFRNLPLTNIKELTLTMSDEDGTVVPYVKYVTRSNRSLSTLEEVRKRLGLDEEILTPTPVATPTPNPVDDITNVPDSGATRAKQYIGQPVSYLLSALGSPNFTDYQDEPETGRTGYYYYDTFTVSTAVDEAGSEVVAGVW